MHSLWPSLVIICLVAAQDYESLPTLGYTTLIPVYLTSSTEESLSTLPPEDPTLNSSPIGPTKTAIVTDPYIVTDVETSLVLTTIVQTQISTFVSYITSMNSEVTTASGGALTSNIITVVPTTFRETFLVPTTVIQTQYSLITIPQPASTVIETTTISLSGSIITSIITYIVPTATFVSTVEGPTQIQSITQIVVSTSLSTTLSAITMSGATTNRLTTLPTMSYTQTEDPTTTLQTVASSHSSSSASISCMSDCRIDVTATRLEYPGQVVVSTVLYPVTVLQVFTNSAGQPVRTSLFLRTVPAATAKLTWVYSSVTLTYPTVYAAYETFSYMTAELATTGCSSTTLSLTLPAPTNYVPLIMATANIPNPSFVAPPVVDYLNSLPTILAQLGRGIKEGACDPIVGSTITGDTQTLGSTEYVVTRSQADQTVTQSLPESSTPLGSASISSTSLNNPITSIVPIASSNAPPASNATPASSNALPASSDTPPDSSNAPPASNAPPTSNATPASSNTPPASNATPAPNVTPSSTTPTSQTISPFSNPSPGSLYSRVSSSNAPPSLNAPLSPTSPPLFSNTPPPSIASPSLSPPSLGPSIILGSSSLASVPSNSAAPPFSAAISLAVLATSNPVLSSSSQLHNTPNTPNLISTIDSSTQSSPPLAALTLTSLATPSTTTSANNISTTPTLTSSATEFMGAATHVRGSNLIGEIELWLIRAARLAFKG